METSLHRELKQFYTEDDETAEQEVRLGNYRIDVVRGGSLLEIQLSSLSAIRDKIATLLKDYDVEIIKPIIAKKTLVKRKKKNGKEISRRQSPKKGVWLDVFEELVYMTRVFPHPRLTLRLALVEIEEYRYPGHGRRRRHRENDFIVEDQKLVRVVDEFALRTLADLRKFLPAGLPKPFHTGDLAKGLNVKRKIAQRIAYTMREMKAIKPVGKEGNAVLYRPCRNRRRAA